MKTFLHLKKANSSSTNTRTETRPTWLDVRAAHASAFHRLLTHICCVFYYFWRGNRALYPVRVIKRCGHEQALRSRRLEDAAVVQRVSLILLSVRRWCLCREMKEVTAVAQPWLDTGWGHGEVVSRSSAAIKALFHTWHLGDCGRPTPRTLRSALLCHTLRRGPDPTGLPVQGELCDSVLKGRYVPGDQL